MKLKNIVHTPNRLNPHTQGRSGQQQRMEVTDTKQSKNKKTQRNNNKPKKKMVFGKLNPY